MITVSVRVRGVALALAGVFLLYTLSFGLYIDTPFQGPYCEDYDWSEREPVRVFDVCMLTDDGLDVLEARLHELDPVVSGFILVESSKHEDGSHRQASYVKTLPALSKFAHKIRHLVVDELITRPLRDGAGRTDMPWTSLTSAAIMRELYECNLNVHYY